MKIKNRPAPRPAWRKKKKLKELFEDRLRKKKMLKELFEDRLRYILETRRQKLYNLDYIFYKEERSM